MSKISLTLIQHVASIVQPICYKSDTPTGDPILKPMSDDPAALLRIYNADWLYEQTVRLVAQMILNFGQGDHGSIQRAIENRLIGEKGTILSAVAEIKKIDNADKALHFKYQVEDKTIQKTITPGDMEIIEEFIRRMPDRKLAKQAEEGGVKP